MSLDYLFLVVFFGVNILGGIVNCFVATEDTGVWTDKGISPKGAYTLIFQLVILGISSGVTLILAILNGPTP